MLETLRLVAPPVLAAATALAFDRATERRGLTPPGFRLLTGGEWVPAARRALAGTALAVTLWVGVFSALGLLGEAPEFDPAAVATGQLFLLHAIFALALALWLGLGFGLDPGQWLNQIGLRARGVLREVALGAAAGFGAWLFVMMTLIVLGMLMLTVGGAESLPREPPPMVPWIAALPIALRLGLSLSAGVFEEAFFRGFLQPRIGIAGSTVLFVLAHLNYEQPLMLVGITLLSLIFAFLVRWRQSVWAAIVAHAVFDAVQLGVVIPWAMRMLEEGGGLMPVALRGLLPLC